MSVMPPTGIPANTAITLVVLSCIHHSYEVGGKMLHCWAVEAKLSAAGDSVVHRCYLVKDSDTPPTAETVALQVLSDLVGDQ